MFLSNDKAKLKKLAEGGMEDEFTIMDPFEGNKLSCEKLKNVYSICNWINDFKQELTMYNMKDVFKMTYSYSVDSQVIPCPTSGSKSVDLFKDHTEIDIKTMQKALTFTY